MGDSFEIATFDSPRFLVTRENINTKTRGIPLITLCIAQKDLACLRIAISLGADLQTKCDHELPVLDAACAYQGEAHMRLLAEHGATNWTHGTTKVISNDALECLADHFVSNPSYEPYTEVIARRAKRLENTLQCITFMRFRVGVCRDLCEVIGKHLWSMRWEM